MTLADWAQCPSCKFPCSAQQFIRIVSAEQRCPLCSAEVELSAIQRVADPVAKLKAAATVSS
jgi:WD repeat-containing protein 19